MSAETRRQKTAGKTVVSTLGNKIRVSKPSTSDWYYKSNTKLYKAYTGKDSGVNTNGNCTWYAYARFMEIQGKQNDGIPPIDRKIGASDAGKWRNQAHPKCATGTVPEAGAVAVFYDPDGVGRGHVMIVEEVYSDGSYWFTDSGYGYYYWKDGLTVQGTNGRGQVRDWMNGNGKSYYKKYKLWKFIYNPAIHGTSAGNPATGTGGQSSDPPSTADYDVKWIYRLPAEVPNDELSKNLVITNDEIKNNATCVYKYLSQHGWKDRPIAAVLGYLQWYSVFCPITLIGESRLHVTMFRPDDEGQAYGLFGWSPSRELYDFILSKNRQIGWIKGEHGFYNKYDLSKESDAFAQLEFFDVWTYHFDTESKKYWKENSSYFEDFLLFKSDDYTVTKHSVDWLARCFCDSWMGIDFYMHDYEKDEIADLAENWYTFIKGSKINNVDALDGSTGNDSVGAESPPDAFQYTKPNNKHLFVVDGGWI